MNKLLSAVVMALCLFALPVHATSQNVKSSPIVEHLLELMQNEDQAMSLGAMLLSTPVNDYWRLEPFVRQSIKQSDPQWVKTIKAFTLYRYTFDSSDATLFIESLPDDQLNFNKLIEFEGSVIRQPGSQILNELKVLSKNRHNKALQEQALLKLETLRLIADGWVAESLGE